MRGPFLFPPAATYIYLILVYDIPVECTANTCGSPESRISKSTHRKFGWPFRDNLSCNYFESLYVICAGKKKCHKNQKLNTSNAFPPTSIRPVLPPVPQIPIQTNISLLPFLLPPPSRRLWCFCHCRHISPRFLRPRRIQIHQIVVLLLHAFLHFNIESASIPQPKRLQLASLILLNTRQQRIARVPERMVAHILRRAENPPGGCCDLLIRSPVGEDHDLVVKVRAFRAL